MPRTGNHAGHFLKKPTLTHTISELVNLHLLADPTYIMDNVFTERLWRSVKYEEVYINDYETVPHAKEGISRSLNFYNQERPHQSLDYRTSAEVYFDIDTQNNETSRYLKEAISCLNNGIHLRFYSETSRSLGLIRFGALI